MENLTTILNEYGWLALVVLLILTNAGKIVAWIEKVLSRVWPAFAEQRRLKLERALATDERLAEQQRLELEMAAAEAERRNTIEALKNMLLEYRESLKESTAERRQLQDRLYELVERYERLAAQNIEILRDVGAAIRLQTTRLDRIGVKVGVYNSDRDKSSAEK